MSKCSSKAASLFDDGIRCILRYLFPHEILSTAIAVCRSWLKAARALPPSCYSMSVVGRGQNRLIQLLHSPFRHWVTEFRQDFSSPFFLPSRNIHLLKSLRRLHTLILARGKCQFQLGQPLEFPATITSLVFELEETYCVKEAARELVSACSRATNLRSLELYLPVPESYFEYDCAVDLSQLVHLSQLTRLHIQGLPFQNKPIMQANNLLTIRQLPSLVDLRLPTLYDRLQDLPTQLINVSLVCERASTNAVMKWLELLPHLQVLEPQEFTDFHAISMVNRWPQLTTLRLNADAVLFHDLYGLPSLASLSNLTNVQLSCPPWAARAHVPLPFLTALPNLQHLTIALFNVLDLSWLSSLAAKGSLVHLTLSDCLFTTILGVAIPHLAHCPSLTHFSLHHEKFCQADEVVECIAQQFAPHFDYALLPNLRSLRISFRPTQPFEWKWGQQFSVPVVSVQGTAAVPLAPPLKTKE